MNSLAPTNVNMRRSCHFCRLRKIRCSGMDICSACHERNIDCVYEAEASKGRPKNGAKRSSKIPKSGSSTPQIGGLSLSEAGFLGYVSPDLANDNLFIELKATFEEFFEKRSSYSTRNQSPHSSTSLEFGQDAFLGAENASSSTSLVLPSIDSDKILETVNYEIIESVCNNVSTLGCEPLARYRSRIVSRSLPLDHTYRMFDPLPRYPAEDPLGEHDSHTTLQMIDVWLSTHPLSCIISKTLFLRSIKNNDYDPALLSIILSDSFGFTINRDGQDEAKFFSRAVGYLRSVSFGTATTSTAQTLILLGWHELRQSRPRQAVCYLSVAARVVRLLWEQITDGEGPCTSKINGISEGEVETEIIINMHWIVSALRLWILLQMDSSLIDLEDSKGFTALPIWNENDSKLLKLDSASVNVSTLNAQARSLRSLLSLSVTTLTAYRLLAIFDQHERFFLAPQDFGWSTSGVPQPADRRMLMDSFTSQARVAIESASKSSYSASQTSVSKAEVDVMCLIFRLAVYFPQAEKQSPHERPMEQKKANDLLALVKLILQQDLLAPHFTRQSELAYHYSNAEPPSELIMMALDISARVIDRLAGYFGGDRGETSPHSAKREDLVRISSMVLELLKSDRLPFSGSRIRPAKRILKRVITILDYQQNSANSLHAMDYSSIGTSSRSSNSSTSPWPVTTQSYSGVHMAGLEAYSLETASENGYLRHMHYDLSPHAGAGVPVTSAAPEIQLPTDYAYSLDDHITTTYPEEHYRMNLPTAGAPEQDRRRTKQYRNNLSRHQVFDMDTQYHY